MPFDSRVPSHRCRKERIVQAAAQRPSLSARYPLSEMLVGEVVAVEWESYPAV